MSAKLMWQERLISLERDTGHKQQSLASKSDLSYSTSTLTTRTQQSLITASPFLQNNKAITETGPKRAE